MGIRNSDAPSLRHIRIMHVFSFFLPLHHPNNRFEHASIFLYAPAKFVVGKKILRGGGWH